MSILKNNFKKRRLINKNLEEAKGSSSDEEDLKIPVKTKIKRGTHRGGPLPMKLRALPQSFWQQPNTSGTILPTSYCPPLDEDAEKTSSSQVVGVANTELLFSLFQNVNAPEEGFPANPVPVVRRGRPKKQKDVKSVIKTTKDDDPYFTSAIVPQIQVEEKEKLAQGRQVLAMISVSGESNNASVNSDYSQRLSDLVVNL